MPPGTTYEGPSFDNSNTKHGIFVNLKHMPLEVAGPFHLSEEYPKPIPFKFEAFEPVIKLPKPP
jgi:hypothetical protein